MKGIAFANGKIGYIPVPKTACTSIKIKLFELEHGRQYDKATDKGDNIHRYWDLSAKDISTCKHRVLICRDPLQRFLSAYSNRVMHHKEISEERTRKHHPELIESINIFNPGLGQFIDDFHTYLNIDTISHHFMPLTTFIDCSVDDFTAIYPLSSLGSFSQMIQEVSDTPCPFPREQAGGKKFNLQDLSRSQFDFLIDYYKDDYDALKAYFSIDSIYKNWVRGT